MSFEINWRDENASRPTKDYEVPERSEWDQL